MLNELRIQLKALQAQNRKSLRTSEHLALTKQIMAIQRDIIIEGNKL